MRAIGAAIDALFVELGGRERGGGRARHRREPRRLHGHRAADRRARPSSTGCRRGDVLVTATTTESFNIVLPLLGAIVTDSGGLLSHAAIVSREYGIPGVVGCRDATALIADGARVRVDGDRGRGRGARVVTAVPLADARDERALRRQGGAARRGAPRRAAGARRASRSPPTSSRRSLGATRRRSRRSTRSAPAGRPLRGALLGHRRGLGRRELRRPAR